MNPMLAAMGGGGGPSEASEMEPPQGMGMPPGQSGGGMTCPLCGQPMVSPDVMPGAPNEMLPPGQLGLGQPMGGMPAGGGGQIPPELLMALLGGGQGQGMGM